MSSSVPSPFYASSHRGDPMVRSGRDDGRTFDALRPVRITRHYTRHAEGSVLIECGHTKVICTVSVEDKVPGWMKGQGRGWLTAEYGMLPRATHTRSEREAARGKQSGRTQEIQRLIGRALRMGCDLQAMGERTLRIDCDVLQADGGTRCAAITGAYVAVHDALAWMLNKGMFAVLPIRDSVAAISVGMKSGQVLLDLDYGEDASCDTDLNLVMTGSGAIVEVQGTAEGTPFTVTELQQMLAVATTGITCLTQLQRQALSSNGSG